MVRKCCTTTKFYGTDVVHYYIVLNEVTKYGVRSEVASYVGYYSHVELSVLAHLEHSRKTRYSVVSGRKNRG